MRVDNRTKNLEKLLSVESFAWMRNNIRSPQHGVKANVGTLLRRVLLVIARMLFGRRLRIGGKEAYGEVRGGF